VVDTLGKEGANQRIPLLEKAGEGTFAEGGLEGGREGGREGVRASQ